jgi:hypothetical protein
MPFIVIGCLRFRSAVQTIKGQGGNQTKPQQNVKFLPDDHEDRRLPALGSGWWWGDDVFGETFRAVHGDYCFSLRECDSAHDCKIARAACQKFERLDGFDSALDAAYSFR